jgi:hypothetical protein
MEGPGTLTRPDGKKIEGRFENELFIGKVDGE